MQLNARNTSMELHVSPFPSPIIYLCEFFQLDALTKAALNAAPPTRPFNHVTSFFLVVLWLCWCGRTCCGAVGARLYLQIAASGGE